MDTGVVPRVAVPYTTPVQPPPAGSRVVRGVRALLKAELPYTLQVKYDAFCNRHGYRLKTIKENGLKIQLRRETADSAFVYNILTNNEYTPAPYFSIRPTDTVIDIGGNIGVFAMVAARQARRVFVYEPHPENFGLLLGNLRANGFNNVTPFRLAVGEAPALGQKLFVSDPNDEATGSHFMDSYFTDNTQRFVEFDVTSLPEIFRQNDIDRCHFLKLDCEASEFQIFDGTPSAIFQRIDRVVMEYHTRSKDPQEKHRQALPLLERLVAEGFEIVDYQESTGFRSGFIRARRPS